MLLRIGTGTNVSFAEAGATTNLSVITVTAASVPKVDVTTVDARSVFTKDDLKRLPIQRSAESIALLAPSTVSGSGYFGAGGNVASGSATGNTVSFGGAGVSENAYYINGYNTTNPYSNIGGIGLPYGVIDQQEVYLGGYSARIWPVGWRRD